MLIPFTARYRLLAALDRLAVYNDKGVVWRKHSEAEAHAERVRALAVIQALVSKLGESNLPSDFLTALKCGALATDLTGIRAERLREHFRKAGKRSAAP